MPPPLSLPIALHHQRTHTHTFSLDCVITDQRVMKRQRPERNKPVMATTTTPLAWWKPGWHWALLLTAVPYHVSGGTTSINLQPIIIIGGRSWWWWTGNTCRLSFPSPTSTAAIAAAHFALHLTLSTGWTREQMARKLRRGQTD